VSWAHDIVIVGGGVGGATLAYELGSLGVDVCLLERCKLPRYKPCGGGLTPRAIKELPVDIREVVEVECHEASMEFRTRVICKKESSSPIVSMVMRDRLDHYLVQRAKELGITLREETRFLDVRGTWGDFRVITDKGGIKACVVVGADGALSKVTRKVALQNASPWMWALEAELEPQNPKELKRIGSAARFEFGFEASGYSWAFPKAGHLSVGTGTLSKRCLNLEQNLSSYIQALGFSNWTVKRKALHPIPFRFTPFPKRPPPKAILIGDAAGITDPITGEGMYYAIRSAKIFRTIFQEFGNDLETMHSTYYQRLESQLFQELWYAHKIAYGFYSRPRLFHSVILLFGRSLLERYYNIILGEKNYRNLLNVFVVNLILKGAQANEKRRRKN